MSDKKTGFSITRQQALADGIFAVAMTLMVLQLTVPIIGGPDINSRLTQELLSMWPKLVSYFLSFFIVGMFWLIHHFIFDNIEYYDTTLAWLNIVFLMFVALIPFSTSLLGTYFLERTPVFIYGLQLFMMFFLGYSLYSYSRGKKQLLKSDESKPLIRAVKVMGYIYFVIILIALVFTFILPLVSIIVYGTVVILFIIFTVIGQPEKVVVWGFKGRLDE